MACAPGVVVLPWERSSEPTPTSCGGHAYVLLRGRMLRTSHIPGVSKPLEEDMRRCNGKVHSPLCFEHGKCEDNFKLRKKVEQLEEQLMEHHQEGGLCRKCGMMTPGGGQ